MALVNLNVSPVAIVAPEIAVKKPEWRITRALMNGTFGMRAEQTLLIKWPKEKDTIYKARLENATLFPAFQRTVATLVGKPFSRAIKLSEDMNAVIKGYCENDIDMQGRNLDTYAAETLTPALAHGFAGILVDFPTRDGVANTQAAETSAGLRPYWVRLMEWDILGYRYTVVNGKKELTQFRFFETVEEPNGDFGVKKILQIRVLGQFAFEIWREQPDKKGEWFKYKFGTTTSPFVRFVPVYGEYIDYMKSRSPLLELGHLNVKHWNSQSDQDNIVHVIRAPILTYESDDEAYELTISPNMGVRIPIGSVMKYVEHTGKAVEAGKAALDDLKDEMRQAGAELLVMRMTAATATEVSADNSVGTCVLQRIVNGLQDAINLALQYTADWIGETGVAGTVTIFNEYGLSTLDAAVAQLILDMSDDAGKTPIISRERAYSEYQRRGVLSPDTSYQDESKLIKNQVKTVVVPPVVANNAPPANKSPTPVAT